MTDTDSVNDLLQPCANDSAILMLSFTILLITRALFLNDCIDTVSFTCLMRSFSLVTISDMFTVSVIVLIIPLNTILLSITDTDSVNDLDHFFPKASDTLNASVTILINVLVLSLNDCMDTVSLMCFIKSFNIDTVSDTLTVSVIVLPSERNGINPIDILTVSVSVFIIPLSLTLTSVTLTVSDNTLPNALYNM